LTISLGTSWGYKVRIHNFSANCVQLGETGWKPFVEWGGTFAEFAGETFHPQTDLPGSTDAKTNFTRIEEVKGSGSWYAGSLSPIEVGAVNAYRYEKVDNSHIRIWTSR
jgi:hypothetical protein